MLELSTIKDVAKLAGVSISTASYALNNSGPVSEVTKKKVLDAANKLEYIPNGVARSLKSRKMGFVGYFTYSLSGPVFGELAKGIEDIFTAYGQEMITCSCTPNSNKVTRLLTEKMVDGAIIMANYLSDDLIKKLASRDFPIVVLDRQMEHPYVSSLTIDNESGVYNVVRYLKDQGYKTIGFLGGPPKSFDSDHRRHGFQKAIKDFNLEMHKEWDIIANFREIEAYREVIKLVESGNLPSAFFGANDEMAIGCMRALQDKGYQVPEDIAVIGFDDIQAGQYVVPKLTTVKRPAYDLGVLAAQTLQNMMNGQIESKQMTLPTQLVIRESCITKEDNVKN